MSETPTGSDVVAAVQAFVTEAEAENARDDAQVATLQQEKAALQADDQSDADRIAALEAQLAAANATIAAMKRRGCEALALFEEIEEVRSSATISRVLAFKAILTDLDADGVADCDRHGNPLPDEGYATQAVTLDGSTYLSIASLTAPGDDTGYLSYVLWFKDLGGEVIFATDPDNFYTSFARLETDLLKLSFVDADQSRTFRIGNFDYPGAGWKCLMVSGSTNLASGEKIAHAYVGDTNVNPGVVDNNDAFVMDFDGVPLKFFNDEWKVTLSGDVADIWFAPGQFIDFSVEANRRKFIDAEGKPVDLGSDGSTPTGVAPAVFFKRDGAASTYATNRGTGGAFTLTGTLTAASTSPSD